MKSKVRDAMTSPHLCTIFNNAFVLSCSPGDKPRGVQIVSRYDGADPYKISLFPVKDFAILAILHSRYSTNYITKSTALVDRKICYNYTDKFRIKNWKINSNG